MIGKTNCKAAQQQPCEKVNINIQSDSASFPGATFTVSYGSYSKTYTWDGSVMTIDIPAYVEYTVSFGEVANFTTPASVTHTAQAGNSRTVDVTYMIAVELLTVNVTGIDSGYEIKIIESTTGTVLYSQTEASKTYSIPAGTAYYVDASDVEGYIFPDTTTSRIAVAGAVHSVTMAYKEFKIGIYIQDIDGSLWTADEYENENEHMFEINGIAVLTEEERFVIALDNAHSSTVAWSTSFTLVSGIATGTSMSDLSSSGALYGDDDTTTLIQQLGTNAPAANYCRNYSFPDGSLGYLGSACEWAAVLRNLDEINNCLNVCYGTTISDTYWTSSQYTQENLSWAFFKEQPYLGIAAVYQETKTNKHYVRAFCRCNR